MGGLSKMPEIEGEIHWIRSFVLQVQCPSLLADRNQAHTSCKSCAMSRMWFEEDTSNRRRVIEEIILCSSSEVPLFIY